MLFRIADTFTDSLAKLTRDEQKSVKTTAFDLQTNPANTGLSFHKLDRAKDKNFWSVRASRDIRLIVHRTESSLLLCYVDHHDDAYKWAERRKLETHPKTGAAQLVEVRETVREIEVPKYVDVETPASSPKRPVFAGVPDDDLLSYGVPPEWLDDVRAANEDSLLDLVSHLPGEASDALLELATGGTPVLPTPKDKVEDPFSHPDAQRRFRVMANVEELERALSYPWDKWSVFLHPSQRDWVERRFGGPARVSGSAGTGKTIVALHRAAHLARAHEDSRVLLTTFSEPLANSLADKLRRLVGNEPLLAERIDVLSLDALAERLYGLAYGKPRIAASQLIRSLLSEAAETVAAGKFTLSFLIAEWENVVDAWQLSSWEAYRDIKRLGRKTRLAESQRQILWSIFEQVQSVLESRGTVTYAQIYGRLASHYNDGRSAPFDFAVVDESQDASVAQLRLLASLCAARPNGLFFAGDLGQRIFRQAFSWSSAGIEIRGRSRVLNVNYRTSHQIRRQADRLLDSEVSDVDGNVEQRNHTVSVFNGPPPRVKSFDSLSDESSEVAAWIREQTENGTEHHEIAVIVRNEDQVSRAQDALNLAELSYVVLDKALATRHGHVSICAMHLAKGLEFKAVVVMACDDEVIPLQSRIEEVSEESDLEEVYETERHLLYVACTRARDSLLVTGVVPESEFLSDLTPGY